ncbi:SPL family radical SAM protein [Parasphaerochaeta coccoides]|uniref:Radical SAM domain protein n=1 Tax=Parasphaerochaeta coccoides (strain ATCC BAA-1237 / DSM 17374 / SPN1) TaxID=760011 RepID=F4GL35_PARC1|nr:radical SAM protein [Parasphaerochaeta coccoides]AEC02375.1 Radical SAM domain protein [Parasphaerochaeta coccoides DSM 17374]
MNVKHIRAKAILTKSALPEADFVINPYTGCYFACNYCYACFMAKFEGRAVSEWGDYVYVKENVKELLEKALKRREYYAGKRVLIGSVTDPYQPIEKNEKITHSILETLIKNNPFGYVEILTKSPIVTRDIDILTRIDNLKVGITVTASSGKRIEYENRAPSNTIRLKTLAKLVESGIKTYAFIGPLLPFYQEKPDELDDIFRVLHNVGVQEVFVEYLNINAQIALRLRGKVPVEVLSKKYLDSSHKKLEVLVNESISRYNFSLRHAEIIQHRKE